MIDFPASPADGQVFSATNGVVYRYSLANTAWLAQNPAPPLGGTGDFYGVYNGADFAISTTYITLPINTVVTGNSGGWYGLGTTSRFVPPAGRFQIFAGYMYYGSATNATGYIHIRKNGVMVGVEETTHQPTAGNFLTITIAGTFDANGADYFEVMIKGIAGNNGRNCYFGAFPLTGMQGPTGGAPGPVVGDFTALLASVALPTTAQVSLNMPVVNGNSGGYYSPTTGRWTPPVGRYFIYASMYAACATAASNVQIQIRKNATVITSSYSTTSTAAFVTAVSCGMNVDANGSDFFDITILGTSNGTNATNLTFGAFPTQGMVGPPGPAGVISNGFRLISRVVPTAGQATIDFTSLPSDINDLELRWDVSPTVAGNNLVLQFYNGSGVLDTTAGNYSWSDLRGIHNNNATTILGYGSAGTSDTARIILTVPPTGANNTAADPVGGRAAINNIRDTARGKTMHWQCYHHDGSNLSSISGSASRRVADAITGLRLSWGSSSFAAGGAVSLWGSP
jgi:hypothetical protein